RVGRGAAGDPVVRRGHPDDRLVREPDPLREPRAGGAGRLVPTAGPRRRPPPRPPGAPPARPGRPRPAPHRLRGPARPRAALPADRGGRDGRDERVGGVGPPAPGGRRGGRVAPRPLTPQTPSRARIPEPNRSVPTRRGSPRPKPRRSTSD